MRPKRSIPFGVFLMAFLWLCPTWDVWGQSQPVLTLKSGAAVLMDGATGQILFEKNPERRFPPASLAKMMTLYLALDAVKRGDTKPDDEVIVSKKAWKMGGSQMFLEVGDKVKFIELIKGAAAISANDGALAIAESMAGSEEVFVHQMNEKAKVLGMENTRFANPHGLPREGQFTTALDMVRLGFHYVRDHPDAIKYHALLWYTYGDIKQKNWNPLLTKNLGVDGLKTGYLRTSGYHILFSSKQDNRRLIGVVMGGETAENRNDDAVKLIGYGFKNFSSHTVVNEGEIVGKVEVPHGSPPEVDLLATKTLVVTVPKGKKASIPLKKEIPPSVNPPISKGNILGKLVLEGEGFPRMEIDLAATQEVRVKSYAVYYLIGVGVLVTLFGWVFWRRRSFRKRR